MGAAGVNRKDSDRIAPGATDRRYSRKRGGRPITILKKGETRWEFPRPPKESLEMVGY